MVIVIVVDTVTRVQILNEAVSTSQSANAFGKRMNLIILHTAMDK